MLRQLQSTSKTKNQLLKPLTRLKNEDNLQWGTRAVADMGTGGSDGWTYVRAARRKRYTVLPPARCAVAFA